MQQEVKGRGLRSSNLSSRMGLKNFSSSSGVGGGIFYFQRMKENNQSIRIFQRLISNGHQQIRFGLFRLFHGGIIEIIGNNRCGIPIILDYSFHIFFGLFRLFFGLFFGLFFFHLDYSDYSSGLFPLLLFRFLECLPLLISEQYPPLLLWFPGY